jgi:hypothetical protein
MATIQRTVYTGQPEPSPLSMRVPARQETRLSITYRDQHGANLSTDISGNIELAGRSGAPSLFYAMTPTDIVNGRAQTTIPQGDLTDPNGYQLWLRGRVGGQPSVIATGTVVLQDIGLTGMGLPASGAGGGVPAQVIERIDLVMPRGTPAHLLTAIWGDEAGTIPLDLVGQTLTAGITSTPGSAVLTNFAVLPGPAAHMLYLDLTVPQLDGLPDNCWWTLVGASGVGAVTYCEGSVTITGEVTP